MMVFRRSPHHCWPADIDIFNRLGERTIRFSHRFLKGVQVDHHQIDGSDAVIGHHLVVLSAPA